MLFGDLNFALVPQTNAAPHLYVFTTKMQNATQRVRAPRSVTARHVPDELLLKLKPGVDINALAKALGAKVIGHDAKLGIYRLQFADAAATDAALAQLQTDPDVEAVDYNYVYDPPPTPQAIANAPVGPLSLTLDPSTPNDPCSPVVGLIDTSVQSLGSQLDPFMLKPISVVGDVATSSTDITHGTAMAQPVLRGVSQQNTSGSPGGSKVRVLSVVVYDSSETTTSWNVALGVQAAVDNGATVLNLSLGGTADSAILDNVIQQALAQGIPVFAAAGNQPVNTPTYPAAIPGVNAVTALGSPGRRESFGSRVTRTWRCRARAWFISAARLMWCREPRPRRLMRPAWRRAQRESIAFRGHKSRARCSRDFPCRKSEIGSGVQGPGFGAV